MTLNQHPVSDLPYKIFTISFLVQTDVYGIEMALKTSYTQFNSTRYWSSNWRFICIFSSIQINTPMIKINKLKNLHKRFLF